MWSLLLLIAVGMDTTSAHTSNPQLVHDHADPTHARRVAAMVGGVVADAAAGPLFWIYDVNEIEQILKAAVRCEPHPCLSAAPPSIHHQMV